MPGEKSRGRRGDGAKLPVKFRNEFGDQGLTDGAVVGRISEDMVPQRTTRVERHPQEFHVSCIVLFERLCRGSHRVRSPEARYLEDHWVAPTRLVVIAGGKQHASANGDLT